LTSVMVSSRAAAIVVIQSALPDVKFSKVGQFRVPFELGHLLGLFETCHFSGCNLASYLVDFIENEVSKFWYHCDNFGISRT
jgi:hypothetical protein